MPKQPDSEMPAFEEVSLKYNPSVWEDEEEWMMDPMASADSSETAKEISSESFIEHIDLHDEGENITYQYSLGPETVELEQELEKTWSYRNSVTYNEPSIHHWNWFGEPVYEASSTSPMESLAALKTQKWRDPANSLYKQSILNRSIQFVDPIIICGSAARKFYSPHGTWTSDDSLNANEHLEDERDHYMYQHPDFDMSTGFWETGDLVYEYEYQKPESDAYAFAWRKAAKEEREPSKLHQTLLMTTESDNCLEIGLGQDTEKPEAVRESVLVTEVEPQQSLLDTPEILAAILKSLEVFETQEITSHESHFETLGVHTTEGVVPPQESLVSLPKTQRAVRNHLDLVFAWSEGTGSVFVTPATRRSILDSQALRLDSKTSHGKDKPQEKSKRGGIREKLKRASEKFLDKLDSTGLSTSRRKKKGWWPFD